MNQHAILIIASAITHVHPGAGRSPGVVDLPVIRDPLGYPYIRGSMIKGALKTSIYNRLKQEKTNTAGDQNNKDENKKDIKSSVSGKIPCNENTYKDLCCLLGGEPGEGDLGVAAISIQDLYPLFIPAPAYMVSPNTSQSNPLELKGIAYVTTWSLLSRALAYAEASGHNKLGNLLENLISMNHNDNILFSTRAKNYNSVLSVAGQLVSISIKTLNGDVKKNLEELSKMLEKLNPLYKAYPVEERLLVLDDLHGRIVIERSLERITRIALDRDTKTVSAQHLWTEEYLPWGTAFIGLIVDTRFRNRYCNGGSDTKTIYKFNQLVKKIGYTVVIGGKESIGSGIIKMKFITERTGQSSEDNIDDSKG